MTYTAKQIEKAKVAYNKYLKIHTLADYDVKAMGRPEAERRMDYHNSIVTKINNGDKQEEKAWKLFFLQEEVKADQKEAASKAKLAANKEASADVLAPVKKLKKLGAFGQWLNNAANPFRKQHFSKKYTQEAVNQFLATL